MSKGNTFENELLELILNNAAIPGVGDPSGLQGSAVAGDLYLSLHTADVGEAGDQTTSEAAYTGYARAAVARDGTGWTVTGNSAQLTSAINFPAGTGGGETVTHFALGTASTGVGKVLYKGAVSPNIVTGDGVTPQLGTGTTITED